MARIACNEHVFFAAAQDYLCRIWNKSLRYKTIDTRSISDVIPEINKPSPDGEVAKNKGEESLKNVEYQILCLEMSPCQTLLAIGTSHKTVMILDPKTLVCLRYFRVPKAITSFAFDQKSEFLIVGDRAGQVCRYAMDIEVHSISKEYKDMTGELSYYEGEPLIGAISMVLDVAISDDNKTLAVADRDEKVRLYRYPQGFVILSFGLGHTSYVSSLCFMNNRLFSAGGDSVINEWDTATGQNVESTPINEGPIKKIITMDNRDGQRYVAAVIENTPALWVRDADRQNNWCINSKSDLLDVSCCKKNVFGICREGLVFFEMDGRRHEILQTPPILLEKLANVQEPISDYSKNVTHNNMADYFKRKTEKKSKGKRPQKRKRTPTDSS